MTIELNKCKFKVNTKFLAEVSKLFSDSKKETMNVAIEIDLFERV